MHGFRMDANMAMEIADALPRDADPVLRKTLADWIPPNDLSVSATFVQGALSGMLIAQYLVAKHSEDKITPAKEGLNDLWNAITEISHLYLTKMDSEAARKN